MDDSATCVSLDHEMSKELLFDEKKCLEEKVKQLRIDQLSVHGNFPSKYEIIILF